MKLTAEKLQEILGEKDKRQTEAKKVKDSLSTFVDNFKNLFLNLECDDFKNIQNKIYTVLDICNGEIKKAELGVKTEDSKKKPTYNWRDWLNNEMFKDTQLNSDKYIEETFSEIKSIAGCDDEIKDDKVYIKTMEYLNTEAALELFKSYVRNNGQPLQEENEKKFHELLFHLDSLVALKYMYDKVRLPARADEGEVNYFKLHHLF